MKLFFCDICNESIPLQDIKESRSTTIKGKIFCRKCNPLNELGPPEGSTRSGGASSALVLVMLLLLLIVAGGLGYVIYELKFAAVESTADPDRARLGALEGELRSLRAELPLIESRLSGLGELEALPGRMTALQEDAAGVASGQTQLFRDVAELQEGLVAVGRLRERLDGMSLRVEELSQDGNRMTDSFRALVDRLDTLSDRALTSISSPGGGAGDSAPGAGGGDAALDEQVLAIIAKLSASEAMERWEAVDEIRRRQDQSLIPRVLPLLDDRDTFVRTQAIYTLGELKARKAVPKLVKLLRDDEIMIREEALTSLVVITGQNFKFDVTGSRNAREKGIKKWEVWLSKNEDDF